MLKAKVLRVPLPSRLEEEVNAFFHRKGIGPDRLVDVKLTALDLSEGEEARRAREYLALILYRE